jgi:hypothetical protein
MPARKKKNVFGWLRKKEVTYHRDVAGERKKLKREALADRRERLAIQKLRAQELAAEAKIKTAERRIAAAEEKVAKAEKKLDKGGMAEAAFEAMKARMEREIEAQEAHKRAALAKINPNRRPTVKSRRNCSTAGLSTEYRLGYNLGQMDRQSAQLPKTPGELHAAFLANFGAAPTADWKLFDEAYSEGYGTFAGGTPARNPRRQVNGGLPKRNAELLDPGYETEEYEQSRKIAELFHGRPVKEEITVTEQIREHDWLWRIGPLVELKVKVLSLKKRPITFPFSQTEDAMVHLFCSPDGRQFYLRGGDQELNLDAIKMGSGTDWFRDHMLIGEVTYITYRDKKKFHRFKLTDYFHKLGEVSKHKPALAYDSLAHKMTILGGQYKVETEDLVDGMSPGIVN